MIRFSAFLVAVALGLLVAGVVTSKLMLVYVAIGVSGVALLALGTGALIKRNELFGQSKTAGPERQAWPEPASAAGAYVPPGQPEPQVAPWEAPVAAASAWPAAAQPAPSRAGYLPAEQPLPTQPVKAQPPAAAGTAARRPPRGSRPPLQAPGSGAWMLPLPSPSARYAVPSRRPPPLPSPLSPLNLPHPARCHPRSPRLPSPLLPSPPKASARRAGPAGRRCASSQPHHPLKTSSPLKTSQGSRTRTSSPPTTT